MATKEQRISTEFQAKPLPLRRQPLEHLLEIGGPALVSQMLSLFSRNAPVKMRQAREARRAGNASLLRQAAHSLKSSFLHLGLDKPYLLCLALEERASGGHLHSAAALLEALEREVNRALIWAEDKLEALSPDSAQLG